MEATGVEEGVSSPRRSSSLPGVAAVAVVAWAAVVTFAAFSASLGRAYTSSDCLRKSVMRGTNMRLSSSAVVLVRPMQSNR